MRKLASIQRVKAVHPIEGRDRIVLADILGWHVIVRKDEIHEGDEVVYIETDSILPDGEAFKEVPPKKRHIRIMKMAGTYSQGIAFPLSILPGDIREYEEGQDVTEILGIKKYEPDENNRNWYKHKHGPSMPKKWWARFKLCRWFWKRFIYKPNYIDFPQGLVPKTDETRVQILGDVIKKYAGQEFVYTEKIDGSSITMWLDNRNKLHVCSRNKEILTHDDIMWKAAETQMQHVMQPNFVYQGEILAPQIQKNKYGIKAPHIFIYNVWNRTIHRYLTPEELANHCMTYNIDTVPHALVPYAYEFTMPSGDDAIDQLVEMAKGMSELSEDFRTKDTPREGIVIRPLEYLEEHDERFVGGRLSFKAINPDFMLKYKL